MSDSEENFDLDVSDSGESDGFVPAPKKATKAAPKKAPAKAAPKATAKPKATKKTKVLVEKDDNADTDDEAVDDDPAPLPGPSAPAAANGKKKTASETYTKVRVHASERVRASCIRWLALAIGAYPRTTGFVHRECGDAYLNDVGLGFRIQAYGK